MSGLPGLCFAGARRSERPLRVDCRFLGWDKQQEWRGARGGVSNGCYKSKIYMFRCAATSQVPISPASIIPGSRRRVRATAGTTSNLSKGGRVHKPSREDIQSMSKTRRRFDKLHLRSFCMNFFYPSLRRTSRRRRSDGGWRGWSALCPAV